MGLGFVWFAGLGLVVWCWLWWFLLFFYHMVYCIHVVFICFWGRALVDGPLRWCLLRSEAECLESPERNACSHWAAIWKSQAAKS